MNTIPEKYYKADMIKPAACTVGELKHLLNELPDDLMIQMGFGAPVALVVYNHSRASECHLCFEEADPDPDDDWD